MKRAILFAALFLAFGLALFFSVTSFAQKPTPSDDEVNRIAKDLYCPICENVPLDVCPTQVCQQWRDLIREQLAAGWTEQQIKDYFVVQAGDRVLAEPPRRGLNWLVYILPPLGIATGIVILFFVFRSMRRPHKTGASPSQEIRPGNNGHENDEYLSRLEEELRRRQD